MSGTRRLSPAERATIRAAQNVARRVESLRETLAPPRYRAMRRALATEFPHEPPPLAFWRRYGHGSLPLLVRVARAKKRNADDIGAFIAAIDAAIASRYTVAKRNRIWGEIHGAIRVIADAPRDEYRAQLAGWLGMADVIALWRTKAP